MNTTRNTSMSTLVTLASIYNCKLEFTFTNGKHGATMTREDARGQLVSDALNNHGYEFSAIIGDGFLPSVFVVSL